jgi:hypothetical protein
MKIVSDQSVGFSNANVNSLPFVSDITDMGPKLMAPEFKPRGAKGDRRRTDRKPYVVEAWICSPTTVDPTTEGLNVQSVNISRHGLAFTCSRALPINTFYTIQILLGEQKLASEIRVIACRPIEENDWEIGAEFC